MRNSEELEPLTSGQRGTGASCQNRVTESRSGPSSPREANILTVTSQEALSQSQ